MLVLPYTTEHVAAAVRLAGQIGIQVLPRGSNTDLGYGSEPPHSGLFISTARMDKILELDSANQRAIVQPGVINIDLSQAVQADGYYFAPDPSSMRISTIGGNIATNSGGPHCLKYGSTINHVQALEMVLHDGSILLTGDGIADATGYDLVSLVVGSEGSLGMVTRAQVRLTRLPEAQRTLLALFPTLAQGEQAANTMMHMGYLPTSLELLDQQAIHAINRAYKLSVSSTAGALLLIEIDGVEDGLDDVLAEIATICRANNASEIRQARTIEEQMRLWTAYTHIPSAQSSRTLAYYMIDAVVPLARRPSIIEQVHVLSQQYDLPMGRIFHAGDSLMHPLVLCNLRNPDEIQQARQIAAELTHLVNAPEPAPEPEHTPEEVAPLPPTNGAELQAMATIYAVFNPQQRFSARKNFPPHIDPLHLALQRQERLKQCYGTLQHATLRESLEQIVGSEWVLSGQHAAPYAIQGHRPLCVVQPSTLDELAGVMRICYQAAASVVPWGGGTQQSIGTLRQTPDVVVVTRRLTGVVHYIPESLSISIGAGTTPDEIQDVLAAQQQFFPYTAPLPDQATIGGLVATATSGSLRPGYGTLRDLLLGLTIVEVDGTIVHSESHPLQHAGGYDLARLLHGSHGTLGVIATVDIKALPQPRTAATLLIHCDQSRQVFNILSDLTTTPLTPSAVDYLDSGSLRRIGIDSDGCALLVRADGIEATCERHLRDLRAIAQRHRCRSADELPTEDEQPLWERVNNLAASVGLPTDEALLRLAVPPSSLSAALHHLHERADWHDLTYDSNAHALSGVIYVRVRGAADALCALQSDLMAVWQHSHVLTCPLECRDAMPVWGTPPPGLSLMQELKRAFDPAHMLNPHRYIV
jgi:D-lactate dehydrogenase (cytochrome)